MINFQYSRAADVSDAIRAEFRELIGRVRPFALDWAHYWWLVFIPIILSSVAGRDRQSNRHGRHGRY